MNYSKSSAKIQNEETFCGKSQSSVGQSMDHKKQRRPLIRSIILGVIGSTILLFAGMLIRNSIIQNRVTAEDLTHMVNMIDSSEQIIEEHMNICIQQLEKGRHPGGIFSNDFVEFEVRENSIIRNYIYDTQTYKDYMERRGWQKIANHQEYEALYQAYKKLYEMATTNSDYDYNSFFSTYSSLKEDYDQCLVDVQSII